MDEEQDGYEEDFDPGDEPYDDYPEEPVIGASQGGPPEDHDPPEAATPPAYIYRGSIVALVLGSFVALFLVLSPPADEASIQPPQEMATNTPAFLETATATPPAATPDPKETPAPPAEPGEPTPAGEPGTMEYEVQPGETLSEIAANFGVTVAEIIALNPGIDPDNVGAGEVILLPVAPE